MKLTLPAGNPTKGNNREKELEPYQNVPEAKIYPELKSCEPTNGLHCLISSG